MVRFKMMVLLVLIAMTALVAQQKNAAPYEKGVIVDGNGDLVQWHRWAGYPPKDYVPQGEIDKDQSKALVIIPDLVPAYSWSYGCTATATAIISAFYDNYGAANVYIGPANGGVAPMTNTAYWGANVQPDTDGLPIAASKEGIDERTTKGHGDDYWTGYLDEGDPYYGGWTEHDPNLGQRATADFMGTNQWHVFNNVDGSTSIYNYAPPTGRKLYDMPDQDNGDGTIGRDGNHGWRLFFESIGMTVEENYNQLVDGYDDPDDTEGPVVDGYTFAHYKASIDKGIPVLIHVIGHSIVGYGYDEAYSPPRVYVRSTWNEDTAHNEYFGWGTEFEGMDHYSMSVLHLAPKEYYSVPQNVLALNDNRTVTVTWDDPSAGTRGISYIVYRDGAQIATTINTTYAETLTSADDGIHNYSVKAVYTDPSPDVTSYMSEVSQVYVCASVTSFYDDFEDAWAGQWLMNPETGSGTNAWGRATTPVYQGSYSLADSPSGDYADGSDQLPAGGHIAEVAPGLNFSAAADATLSFWMNYEIEESFDYLHLQATEDGTVWTTLKTWSYELSWGTWNFEEIALGMYAGQSNVRFRFIMVTDPGYVCAGAYIDNFSIQPSSVDSTPPYVYYTKAVDYYTEWPNGHWLETRIVDFTGIDYARILYKVNGGLEQTLNYSAVNGEYYQFQFPDLVDGDMVEFRFDCQDTYSPANQGYTGPFYYVHGLHQKYDYATVSYYTYVVTTTAQYDQKSYANKFTSFHDAVVGAVVRGYIDSTTGANNDMMMNVWADNSGVPGATMITPFAYPNPATLSNTNAWGYVDMSGYTALSDMEGDYFVGFECAAGGTEKTHTVTTSASESGEYDFKRAWVQYYATNGADLTWEQTVGSNHHLRLVTTNNEAVPGEITPNPVHIVKDVLGTATQLLEVWNTGGYTIDSWTGSIEYIGFASGATVDTNNFDTELGWTGSTIVWTRSDNHDGGNLNGTFMAVATHGGGGMPGSTKTGYLTSPTTYNLSSYGRAEISWIQKTSFTNTNQSAGLQMSNDGTTWTTIYSTASNRGEWGNGDAQTIVVPSQFLTSTARIRYFAVLVNAALSYYAIDDVKLDGMLPYTWMTLDAGTTTSGTNLAVNAKHDVNVGFDTTGLTLGETYSANIKLNSQYSNASVRVDLTVKDSELLPPANVVTAMSGTDVRISWDAVTGADSYDVYSSTDPYAATFTLLGNTVNTYYDFTPGTNNKMFFHVVAKNAAKALPRRTIKDVKKEISGN